MHISEGVLSPAALATGWAVAAAGMAIGLKKMNSDKIVRVSLLSSAFFLASLINVKVGPSSTHLSLIAPMGLILGWSVFPAVVVALFLQAVLFHFGGIVVLGANTVDVAVPALFVYLVFSRFIRNHDGIVPLVAAFVAGVAAVLICALGVGFFLGMTDSSFSAVARTVFFAHIPLAFIEGLITSFMVVWMKKAAPEFLDGADRP